MRIRKIDMNPNPVILTESQRIAKAVENYMDAKLLKGDLESVVLISLTEALLQGRLKGLSDKQAAAPSSRV